MTFPYLVKVNGKGYEVDLSIENVEYDGIGPYEYWGAKGFDKGQPYVEEWEAVDSRTEDGQPLSDEEKKIVLDFVNGGENGELDDKIDDYMNETALPEWEALQEPDEEYPRKDDEE